MVTYVTQVACYAQALNVYNSKCGGDDAGDHIIFFRGTGDTGLMSLTINT